jgi:hypothetical protein
MDHPIFTAFVLFAGLVLAVVAQWRGWRPSLRIALVIGIGLRLVLLVSASIDSWQPVDFKNSFEPAGKAILHHQDPVLAPNSGWHFLPMSAYAYALALLTHLPWQVCGRLYPMIADIVLIVLVGKLARDRGPLSRFQYACNPIALMVSTIHAQLESVALVFLVGSYLATRGSEGLFRRMGPGVAAGLLFGFALSAKSWPIILLPVLLAMLPSMRERIRALVAAAAVPILFFLSLPIVVGTPVSKLLDVARVIGGVRPIIGEWGWTAWLTGGDEELVSRAASIGELVLYGTVAVVMVWWWRSDRIDQTAAILLAFMIVTPRMGSQYLLWFVPFLTARPTRWTQPALLVAAVWAGLGYMYLTQFDDTGWWINHEWWSRSSVIVLPFLLLAIPWSRRVPLRQSSNELRSGEGRPEPAIAG